MTCTRADSLAAGASYPVITVTVNVSSSAPATVINSVTVSGGGELNANNSSASDATAVTPITDLIVTKQHAGSFTQGATGKIYTITVRNAGGLATSGTVTVFGAYSGSRAILRSIGMRSTCAFDRHEVGLPGMPRTGFPSAFPRMVGFPGLTAMP